MTARVNVTYRELRCVRCNQTWNRPIQQGRLPEYCPDCQPKRRRETHNRHKLYA